MELVIARHINYVDLKNGNLTLYDCALISDAYVVKSENEIRINNYINNEKNKWNG